MSGLTPALGVPDGPGDAPTMGGELVIVVGGKRMPSPGNHADGRASWRALHLATTRNPGSPFVASCRGQFEASGFLTVAQVEALDRVQRPRQRWFPYTAAARAVIYGDGLDTLGGDDDPAGYG